jgi:peptidoglycan hydrolase CwlO-like protein
MNKRIGRKQAVAIFVLMFLLGSGLFCSLFLVQGDKPADAGQPPSGIIAELNDRLNFLKENVTDLQNQINDARAEIGNANDALASILANLQSQIDNINAAMEDLHTWVGNLDALIDNNYNDLKAQINVNKIAVEDLQTWVSDLAASIDSNQQNVNDILNDLVNAIATLNTWVSNLDALIDSNQQNLQNQIDSLQSQIDSLNTRLPTDGKVVIPAASFVVSQTTANPIIHNQGDRLSVLEAPAIFYAGLQLPNGVTLTRITFYWFDNGEGGTSLQLCWGGGAVVANLVSNGGSGYGFTSQPLSHSVDVNSPYFLRLGIAPSDPSSGSMYDFEYAVIEYEYLT